MCVDGRDYWRCPVCVATFLDPAQLPGIESERREYELHRNAPGDPGYRRFLQRLSVPLLARLAPARRGLDYGCGPGPALASMLREAGHDVVVYDPFYFDLPEVLERRYDFITCTEVVEHFHRPATEFTRLGRMLAPGGVLAVMTCFQTDDNRFANWHYRRDPTHVVFYRQATFEWLAHLHGWHCEVPCRNVALLHKPVSASAPAASTSPATG